MHPIPGPIGLFIAFAILTLIFFVLQKISPGKRGQRFFRDGYKLDFFYWFVTPWVSGLATRILVFMTALPVILLLGLSIDSFRQHAYHGFGPLSRQPAALQAFEIFLLGDLISYWMHRLFHGRRLWSFHAIHHSSTEIDWLSSVRLHPANEAVTRSVEIIPLLLTGFNPVVLASYVPVLTLYALFLHANVNWSFGPLRYVIASPVFHRWHHSKEPDAIDKNFSGFFAFWDILFGTFYVPRGKVPTDFGVLEPVPESLWGQLTHPFRRSPSQPQ